MPSLSVIGEVYEYDPNGRRDSTLSWRMTFGAAIRHSKGRPGTLVLWRHPSHDDVWLWEGKRTTNVPTRAREDWL